jgi:biotin carboxyl carrier protein
LHFVPRADQRQATAVRAERRLVGPATERDRPRWPAGADRRDLHGPVEDGQDVAEGDLVVVLEAMKMEQPINAHKAGTITGLQAEVGQTVTNGAVIADIKD